MRLESPSISWHGTKDRVLSIDFHPFSGQFVSAGSDERKFEEKEQVEGTQGCIKVWEITSKTGEDFQVKILYGLTEAVSNVNVVRYSPDGNFLASGSDDKSVIIWHRKKKFVSFTRSEMEVRWAVHYPLAGHTQDVLDLRWSHNSKYVISAGMDGHVLIFDVEKKYHVKVLDEHDKFVQGLAVDLRFEHIITASSDRSVKVWKVIKSRKTETGFYCKKTIKRFSNKKDDEEADPNDRSSGFRMFFDENTPTFFRRPDISPDGELYLLPAGIWQENPKNPAQYCAFLYRKNYLDRPTTYIPTQGEPVLICKFCPKLFRKKDASLGLFQQPYYMVFAVATSYSVFIYDTLNLKPIYGMGNYHYAALTDLSWHKDKMLAISSSDGYCSFMVFQEGELGESYEAEGELGELMKVKEHVAVPSQKTDQAPSQPQEQKVYYTQRATENGIKRIKKIVAEKVAD